MTFHMSFGIVILILILLRLAWRLAHPVAPESSLPAWQRLTSEAVHWLLYALVLATTVTGWLFASFRGWSISLFYLVPLPRLAAENPSAVKAFDGWHQAMEWTLLVVIGIHVATAMAHIFIYRDRVMQRMLPDKYAAQLSRRQARHSGAWSGLWRAPDDRPRETNPESVPHNLGILGSSPVRRSDVTSATHQT